MSSPVPLALGVICLKLPPYPNPPALPSGISIPLPTLPSLPNIGLCCKINLPTSLLTPPTWPASIPIPFAAISIFVTATFTAVKAYLDALEAAVACPLES